MGYPNDILESRAVIRHGSYALIPPGGTVNNVIPGMEDCRVSIVASPKLGASFVQYIVDVEPNGRTTSPFAAQPGIESFLYVVEGGVQAQAGDGNREQLEAGGYLYAPPGRGLSFAGLGDAPAKMVLYKQRFIPLGDEIPAAVVGNANAMAFRDYDGMGNVQIKDLLPTDLVYDMNFHILTFAPGGCHPFIETHVQEHGAYMLEGEGLYYLGEQWMPIKKGDYVWFGPFTTQGAYGVGRENFTYVYSKDCNRDVAL